jgi:hypothetical protein
MNTLISGQHTDNSADSKSLCLIFMTDAGEALPDQEGGAAVCGWLGPVREPGGAGGLLRAAPPLQQGQAQAPHHRGAHTEAPRRTFLLLFLLIA